MIETMLRVWLCLLIAVRVFAAADPAALDAIVAKSMRAWGVPGVAVAIVKNDKVILAKGYGVRELGKPEPVTADTIFAIGSTTKAFTTAAMAILADEGRLRWDDPVRRHIEYFRLADPLASEQVTLRDLVSHRTGLSRHDELWYGSPWTSEELLRRIGEVPLTKPFRCCWQYQNVMFLAAGYAAGHAAGTTWQDLIQRRVFDPLRMTGANFTPAAAMAAADHSTPHRKNAQGEVKVIPWRNLDSIAPAAAINASVNALTHWIRMQLNDGMFEGRRLISSANVAEMRTPQTAMRPEDWGRSWNPESNQVSYGLGWFLQDYRGLHLVQHGGAIDGFRAQITLVPREKLGIVVLSNLNEENMPEALRYQLLDALLGLPAKDWDAVLIDHFQKIDAAAKLQELAFVANRQPGTKPSHELSAYEGDYQNAGYGIVHVKVAGPTLELDWRGNVRQLEHFHYDTFLTPEKQPVDFRLNSAGQVVGLRFFETEFRAKL